MTSISSWARIASAVDYYTGYCDYEYMDVPWFVGRFAYDATKPEGARDIAVTTWGDQWNKHYLVASGEQSFLSLMVNGREIKDAVCVTPCFRDEPIYDATHLREFMKVELISTTRTVNEVLNSAFHFFAQYTEESKLVVEKTDIGYDIMLNGHEIGSYGERVLGNLRWVYGTGIAEPRFTYAHGVAT